MSCSSLVAVDVLLVFLVVPWVGLQCVILVFSDHTHLLFAKKQIRISKKLIRIAKKPIMIAKRQIYKYQMKGFWSYFS